MAKLDSIEQVLFPTPKALRSWFAAHHGQTASIWGVTWKRGSGGPYLSYPDLRDEALCWGWIDSLPRRLDDQRTMHLLSPRRAGSAWSAINKARITALSEAGRMKPPGLAAIERSKADGGWTALDGVETLRPPPDLVAALQDAGADEIFARFPPSSRRAILEWIALAKRPETRGKRLQETARLAVLGLRVNHPEARGQ